jgi:hypothetical protein
MKTPLVLRYFLWSMLIFAVSMFCFSFRMLDSLLYKAPAVGVYLYHGPFWRTLKQTEFPYRNLNVLGLQISQEQYFRIVQDVVPRLKRAGAKVIIVPMPDFFEPRPQINKIIQEIAADSIVIFAAQGTFNSILPWDRDVRIENKSSWWVRHPFFHRLNLPWGVMSPAAKDNDPLIRFVPRGIRDSETGEPVADVATMALKRYFGIPDREDLPLSRSRLLVGPLGIQIAQDGISYVRIAYNLKRQSELSASINPTTDSLEYYPAWDESRRNTISLEEAWSNHKGSIVMIDWAGARRYQYVYYGWTYLQIFGAVFNGSFLTIHNEWNVLVITTLVVLLSVFSYTFRNSLTVLVSIVLTVAAVIISGWLFIGYNILFEPIYIIVPIVLCGFILPLVKLSGEKRIAEERIKSLEEENRRLLDLQRLAPHQVLP